MEYSASEKLAQILLSNGFEETTKREYPEHFERMSTEGYNPQIVKRSFSLGRRMSIIFDYINIKSYGNFTNFRSYSLKEDELKSILTYVKLPNHTQSAIKKRCKNILEIADEYEQICENPKWHNGATDMRLKETFNKIRI